MNISQTIAKIWEKVLNIQDINPNDNFFDLGGSSREALEILYEVELQLNIKLSISSIFSNPSLGEFCSYCSKFSSVETENTVVEQSIAC
ncbi:MAG: phosphopantetheine-binding protein, partial [Sphaerospermopsis kisseleviana]